VPARDHSGQAKKGERVTASHPGGHREGDKLGYGKEVVGKEHSLPGEHRGTDKLGHGKEANERGALTLWRVWRETSQDEERKQRNKALTIWRYKQRKIRAQEESRQTRGTHQLETAGGDRSGHRKNAIK
jgi:hypothetical protein